MKHRAPRRSRSDYWIGVMTGVLSLAVLIMVIWALTGGGPR